MAGLGITHAPIVYGPTSSNNEKVDHCIGALVCVLSRSPVKAFRDEPTLNLNLPVEFRVAFSPRTARGAILQDERAMRTPKVVASQVVSVRCLDRPESYLICLVHLNLTGGT